MKTFLFKILLFVVCIGGFSYLLDYMIQEGLKSSNYREVTKWNEVIQGEINAEILIVGSSRALVHFDCEYIQKVTGKSCYNLGFDGTTYPLQKLMLELYLSRNKKPIELIWSLDYHSFSEVPDFYGFEQLIPYKDNPYIGEMLSMHETPSYQFYLPVFRYSYNPKMKVIGLYSFLGKYSRDQILKNGYRAQKKVWDETFDSFKGDNPKGLKMNFIGSLFQDFITLNEKLKSSSINQKWIVPPYYFEVNQLIRNRSEILQEFSKTSKDHEITFLDYSNSFITKSKSNFYNGNHLNDLGVRIFMDELMSTNNLFPK